MEVFILSFLFLVGISVGSFVNVVEMRLFKRMDFVKKRSHCPKCKEILRAWDLLPLLSFSMLKGRCRYCETSVSRQYPIVEFLSGVLFMLSGWYVTSKMHIYGFSEFSFALCISVFIGLLLSLFLFFAIYDVKHQIVPNRVVVPGIIFAFCLDLILAVTMHLSPSHGVLVFFEDFHLLWNITAGVLGGLFIISIIVITKGKGMGGGDLKLVILMGLLLGPKKFIIAMYIAVISGSVGGVIWGLYKGKLKGLRIPFGLFLSFGAIIAFLIGMEVWRLFFGSFLL